MRARWRSTILLLAVLVPASGCLITGALDAQGGGRLRLHYRVVSVLHFEQHKAMLQSPGVVLESSAMTPDKWVTFDITFTDVRALPTVPLLSHLHVDLQEARPGSQTLGVTIDNPAAAPMPEVVRDYVGRDFQISLELPGNVLESNGHASGERTVEWSLPVDDAAARPTLSFTATYKAGG
jgi:hypothetical protein